MRIYGDDRANIIQAGGDGYYDTQYIIGGKGDDALYSSSIARTYFYYTKGDGNDTSMDSIIEENYSVTNIETSDFNSLTNDEFNLTYSQTEDQK